MKTERTPAVCEKGRHAAYEGQTRPNAFDGDTAEDFDRWSARDSRCDAGLPGTERRIDPMPDPLDQLIAEEEGGSAEEEDRPLPAQVEQAHDASSSARDAWEEFCLIYGSQLELMPGKEPPAPDRPLPPDALDAEEHFDQLSGAAPAESYLAGAASKARRHNYGRGTGSGGNRHQPHRKAS